MNKILDKISFNFKAKEWLMVIGITSLSLIMIDRIFFSVVRSKIKSVQVKIKAEESRLSGVLPMEVQKDAILREYINVKPYCLTDQSTQETMTRFLKEVERITQEVRVNVTSLLPKQDFVQDRNYKKYQLELQFEGDIGQVYTFFSRIQESKFLLKIERFALSTKGEGTQLLRLDTTISFTIYVTS